MSIKVMTHVWDGFPGSGSELLMMLALADRCDEEGGRLWPSILTLAKRCRVSESQARRILRDLEKRGYVAVVGNHDGGKPGTTRQYQLNVTKIAQDAASDLPHIKAKPKGQIKIAAYAEEDTGCIGATPCMDATPRMDAQDGLHGCARTPRMDASLSVKDHPSMILKDIGVSCEAPYAQASCDSSAELAKGQHLAAASDAASISPMIQLSLSGSDDAVGKEPKKIGKAKATKGSVVDIGILAIPDWLPRDQLKAFMDYREERKKPMTQRAVELLIIELTKIRDAGHDPVAALNRSILNSWIGVFPPSPDLTPLGPREFPGKKRFDPRQHVNRNQTGSQDHVEEDRDCIDGHAVRLD